MKWRRQNARRRGATIGQHYTLRSVYERDAGRCHLCGKAVNISIPASQPLGPTIDHLVPLSAGGWDCSTNVALAHRECNVKRGAGGAAQLRLVVA
jgi:5-methylcytosine-specific restriction endonuclease McrA